jgi:hypothetical protein
MHPGLALLKLILELAFPWQHTDNGSNGHQKKKPVKYAFIFALDKRKNVLHRINNIAQWLYKNTNFVEARDSSHCL